MELTIYNIKSITRSSPRKINKKFVRNIDIETTDGQKITLSCWADDIDNLIIKKED